MVHNNHNTQTIFPKNNSPIIGIYYSIEEDLMTDQNSEEWYAVRKDWLSDKLKNVC